MNTLLYFIPTVQLSQFLHKQFTTTYYQAMQNRKELDLEAVCGIVGYNNITNNNNLST